MSYNVFLNDLKIVRYLYREKLSPTLISIFISPTLLLRKTKSNSHLKFISPTISLRKTKFKISLRKTKSNSHFKFISPTISLWKTKFKISLRKTKSNSQLKLYKLSCSYLCLWTEAIIFYQMFWIFLGISIDNFVLKFTLNLYLEKNIHI